MNTETKQALRELIKAGLTFADALGVFAEGNTDEDKAYIDAAKVKHTFDEGELEVDESSIVSKGDDDGAYVLAWTWVSDDVDDES